MKRQYSEEIQKLLKCIHDDCMKEDTAVRERQIRQWRRLKLLWEGFNRIWFSEVAHDWRIYDGANDEQDTDQAYYDKPINIFKAYLESIIAALSVTVPPIKCFPDDADNTLDLATAKAGDKIAQLVYRHNNAGLKWLHGLFVYCTEGMVAYYTYPEYSDKYGTYDEEEYENIETEVESAVCSVCGFPIEQREEYPGQADQIREGTIDEFQPDSDKVPLESMIEQGMDVCPSCSAMMVPSIVKEQFVTTRLVGVTKHPKSRICIEPIGGLYVKIPNYCKKQADLPYLDYSCEKDYSMVIEEYEHLHGNKKLIAKMRKGGMAPGGYESYAQWGRLSPQYQGEYPENVVTVSKTWIRPGKFNILPDKDDVKKLKKLFPKGVKVVFVEDEFAEACPECLDDYWTLTENPLADYLHFDPLGQSLVSVQEITNDIISLVLQTIEHGIGQTFVDPAVVDLNAYEQVSVLPGGIFPTKQGRSRPVGEGFYQLKTATLSAEVMPFNQSIQTMGQMTSGALPAIFGGQQEGAGGDTASGYSQAKSGALQRLQNQWKLITITWKDAFGKIIPMYINLVKEDERDVQRTKDGNFVNVMIRKAELEGKIGKVELEANENLPMTWNQKKDLYMTLLQATNPQIMGILNAPENLPVIHEALGLPDLVLPGEDDVIKQYDEIKQLLASQPIIQPPDPMMTEQAVMQGMPPPPEQEIPSVEVDPDFDNHAIEFEVCRKWIISEAGRQAKTDNPEGYKNVLLHGKAHLMLMQQQLMQQQMQQAQQGQQDNTPNEKRDKTKDEAPIREEGDVPVAQ